MASFIFYLKCPQILNQWTTNLSLCLFSSVPSLSRVWLFANPWTAARQASLSVTNSQSLLKLMSIELVMPSNHLILCCLLLLLPSIFPSIRVFFQSVSFSHQVAKVCPLGTPFLPQNATCGLWGDRWLRYYLWRLEKCYKQVKKMRRNLNVPLDRLNEEICTEWAGE